MLGVFPNPGIGVKVLRAGPPPKWETSRTLLKVWKGKSLGEAKTPLPGWEVGRRKAGAAEEEA